MAQGSRRSGQAPGLAGPQVRYHPPLGRLFRARHGRIVADHVRGLDHARHHPHLRRRETLVLGPQSRLQPHAVRPRAVGTCLPRSRYEVCRLHHQAPRRLLPLRHPHHRLQSHQQRLQRQSPRRRAALCDGCLSCRRADGRYVLLEARLAQSRLLVVRQGHAHAPSQLQHQGLSRAVGTLQAIRLRPGR